MRSSLPSQGGLPYQHRAKSSDPNRLAPEDAFVANSPPRRPFGSGSTNGTTASLKNLPSRIGQGSRKKREKERDRSSSRRRGAWKKLLWVKQSYPDNYTDKETFLDHLQRNPRLQPYNFWPLVADSTVIVQHVCSVIIFACCFVGIFQERASPVAVVGWASLGTVLGWILWDGWIGQGAGGSTGGESTGDSPDDGSSASSTSSFNAELQMKDVGIPQGLGLSIPPSTSHVGQKHSRSASGTSLQSVSPASSPTAGHSNGASFGKFPPDKITGSSFSPRNQQRVATAKSAILIYCALLGLSPILKSLTKSTTSDSIWAMSGWLMCINVFFFDYGGDVGVRFPASLSTNAALMASTVLASRLPSTTHVFSLTLFSIEVFGLFPAFRRYLRHWSWHGHLALTILLVLGASGGVGITVSGGGYKAAAVGVILGSLFTSLGMGICSWWLIGLQKYKNEIRGPWDPARPIIRRHWD
ncbi:MAG: hypothetical protein M1837_000794 [Sclerophora amabilis]|nr:MAG: hypothetical protein M1837_000794 [Sclerophora amabilis]